VPQAAARAFAWFSGFTQGAGWWVAGAVFDAAFLTDALDGHIARKYGMITDLGKFLDPLADKLLVTSALFALVARGAVGAFAAILIVSRELMVTGIRLLAAKDGVVIAASGLGKTKTTLQTAAILFLLFQDFRVPLLERCHAGLVLFYAALAMTIWSGADYLVRNRHLLRQ
jgi:CDP-diacylglycerol--glycerol-3-phosphate 3-phosphatidyltransferase